MEYLHSSSVPVSKTELQIFHVPPTQTAIESSYEVEYRPTSSVESGKSFEIQVQASDDFTDLQATMLHVYVSVTTSDGKGLGDVNKIKPVKNFANALFEQVDLFLGTVNTSQAHNMYHYQAWFEDELFRHPNPADKGRMEDVDEDTMKKSSFDLYYRLHLPLCEQDKLIINAVPMLFRFTKSADNFPLLKYDATDAASYLLKINYVSLHIKRVKLFPDAALSLLKGLSMSPAKYFVTRNETRCFDIGANISVAAIENIFTGMLPRRIIIGFVNDLAFGGSITHDPFKFEHFSINYLALYVDGVMIPSIPYTPNFSDGIYMREYVNLYRYLNQDEGHPQMNITHADYADGKTLFAFDLTADGSIGAENGTLSLIRRGIIRMQVKFSKSLVKPIKAIIFAQFDNYIAIDANRNVSIDY
uniref:Uncharacterized protein n=1 Tax=Tetranychus urticae TaxID=32264 RepID=A0A158P4S2_TETUR